MRAPLNLCALALSSATLALTAAAPAQAETLREALAAAYNNNPTLQGARANQRATDEDVPINKADARPSLDTNSGLTEFVRANQNNFFQPQRVFTFQSNLGVPIYNGGAVKNGIKAAKERVAAGRADLRATESAIFSQTVAAYLDVLRTEALANLAANQVEVLTVNLEATSDRFEIGDVTRTDVAQSQSRLALAEGDLRTALANLVSARETYIQLVGRAPIDLASPPPLPGLPGSVEDAVVLALQNNPDLIAAKERAEAAGYDSEVAGSGRLPTLSAFGTYDYQNTLGTVPDQVIPGENPGDPATVIPSDQTATGIQAGLTLRIPIFQGGRVAAQQRQAFARETVAMEQMIETERSVIQQTRAAYASWRAALAVIDSSRVAVESAEVSLEGVRAENSIGNRTILDVLNAEQELVSAKAQLVTARRDAYVAGFTLLAAMGRAEARDLNLDTGGPLYDPDVNYERIKGKIWDWDRDPEPAPKSTRTVDIPAADATYGPLDIE
ncbi:MAG: TolC family outer membrane protein [Erythrobacter sp.]|uniref:TolC family outer membrane protein n=1 Tax=Erythrobacter sp. TaxID=1042 RepID=UPI00261FC035|nr:TolC family outer membrane protein [Erythrobacter sp.]MDJ0978495.1 TolC family outer membrane protein [Erythrobacter sp.]